MKTKPLYKSRGQNDWRVGSTVPMSRLTSRQTGALPFGVRYLARLPYGCNETMTTAGSSNLSVSQVYRLNSLFDPDQTGTGHQPYQFDQLNSIYEQYRVDEVEIDLVFSLPTIGGLWVGWSITPSTDAGDAASGKTLDILMERGLFVCKQVSLYGEQQVRIRQHVKIHEVLGISKEAYSNVFDYGALVGANPTNVVSLRCFLVDPNSLVAVQSIRICGKITYHAELSSYEGPAQS